MQSDARWMDYAARLGHRALGTTAENPPVGCVIVKDGLVLGVGCTQAGGRPHAEVQALAMAGTKAKGATAYVTLEPCSHHGRTPPCAEALVAAGISRAVVAFEDPDPRVSGSGMAKLVAAGIKVDMLVNDRAAEDLAGFFTRITKNRPYVILKLAVSADGMLAAAPGQRTAITGPEVKARVHLLRSQVDAILVGRKTVEVDVPQLNVRLPGLESRSPQPVILTSGAKPLPKSSLSSPWIFSVDQTLTTVSSEKRGTGTKFTEMLAELANRGVNRLLVEGGSETARSFLEAGLVDEAQIFENPKQLGSGGLPAPLNLLSTLNPIAREALGADTLTVYQKR